MRGLRTLERAVPPHPNPLPHGERERIELVDTLWIEFTETCSNVIYIEPKLAGARRVFRRAPFTYQPACKPGSVGHDPLAQAVRDSHSSATPVARRLKQPTRTAGSGHRSRSTSLRPRLVPSLFGLAPGGVCRAAGVAAGAVRSYRTVSPLPRLTLRTAAVCSLWHFP